MAAIGLTCAAGLLGLDRFVLRATESQVAQSSSRGRVVPAGAR
jgi:hypothetical protein